MSKERENELNRLAAMLQVAAANTKEIAPKDAIDLLMKAKETDLIGPDPGAETQKGNANPPEVWVWSPARLHLSTLAGRRLLTTAGWANIRTRVVTRAHVRVVGTSKVVIIKPAPETDKTALEVQHYDGKPGSYINLYDLLAPVGLAIQPGYRERFEIFYIPEGSPFWPGLFVDLSLVKERRAVPKRKPKTKSSGKKETPKTAPPGKDSPEAKSPETESPETEPPETE